MYAPETWEQRRVIYSSTFNIRCANGKLAIVALMALMAWVSVDTAPALYGLGAFLQAQMIVLPLLGLFAAVHSLSWWHKLVVQARPLPRLCTPAHLLTTRALPACRRACRRCELPRTAGRTACCCQRLIALIATTQGVVEPSARAAGHGRLHRLR